LESIEANTGRFKEGELTKTPEAPQANSFRFGAEHVLYGKLRPYLNKVALADFDGKCSTEIIPLLPNTDVDRAFLAYFLRSQQSVDSISAKTAGARMPRADMDFVFCLEMGLPNLPEQRRIVDILTRAEGIVRLRREAEKKAAEFIPALFVDMIGDPATNPKGWPVIALSDVCGKCATYDPRKNPDTTFSYIDIAAIDNGRGEIVDAKLTLGADAPSRARQIVKRGDVIVSTVRPNLRGSALVPQEQDGQICSTGFCVLRPKDITASAFIYALVRGEWFVAEIVKKVRGAQYPAVSDKDLFSLPIPLPPAAIQRQFAAKFADIVAIQSQQTAATAKAQATFDALLARTFDQVTKPCPT
jgi:type I restriction enzyme S subunit